MAKITGTEVPELSSTDPESGALFRLRKRNLHLPVSYDWLINLQACSVVRAGDGDPFAAERLPHILALELPELIRRTAAKTLRRPRNLVSMTQEQLAS